MSIKLHTALLNGSTATDEVLELEDEVVVSNGTDGTLVRRAVLKTIAGIELDLLHGNELPMFPARLSPNVPPQGLEQQVGCRGVVMPGRRPGHGELPLLTPGPRIL